MPRKINQSNVKQGAASASSQGGHDDSSGVTALVAGIVHPLKATLEAVRRTILSADPAIAEGREVELAQLLLPRLVCYHQQPQADANRYGVFLWREGACQQYGQRGHRRSRALADLAIERQGAALLHE
jgi:hypothetical protein